MAETQDSINRWATSVFGHSTAGILRTAIRGNEEYAELLAEIAVNGPSEKAAEEMADVAILLLVLAGRSGVDLQDEIDRKMAKNRARKWRVDTSGHGYHIPDEAA
ncbi:MazG-like family protein [Aurantimonas coralicida]|uniref:MazG-like family protein n=1 Tax=Aurantimonas coralicida TaxID=182270 RepID=UPI001E4B8493|nr:MazG-like family protein [Aurantimonas coralicida]MCD1645225.1 DUF550 domain-containing protein [Aurantimonas coralicida]